jgi:hypothetical protein
MTRLATLNILGLLSGTFAVDGTFGLISSEIDPENGARQYALRRKRKRTQIMKLGKLVAGAASLILFAGCAVEHNSGKQQTELTQSDVSRYVAAMSEQPGQLALKHQCGHERSWTRLEGLSTENE